MYRLWVSFDGGNKYSSLEESDDYKHLKSKIARFEKIAGFRWAIVEKDGVVIEVGIQTHASLNIAKRKAAFLANSPEELDDLFCSELVAKHGSKAMRSEELIIIAVTRKHNAN